MPDVPAGFPSKLTSASIIIPTFNGASRIGNCLDSLVKQTAGRNVEILVVDDGSTDNTADVVRGYSSVRLITRQMRGLQRRAIVGPWRRKGRSSCLPTTIACRCQTGWTRCLSPSRTRTWLERKASIAHTRRVWLLALCRSSMKTNIG